ncbi:MptD family putative ECF transporter S component [Streptosporangium saharense]|uniref:Energy-coupling factor transport system substrate-specific component n=1 Tax=Streptosporangium saharense TaxID=1706840 RepID=A0A7W7QJT0_9ACTN|nr:MptD family putative ECF transporter S component [Streptosporangium saharense]MBB4914808.1 energy-coupling factor transport system substrate-specific component [Streptosporangium saharense]
MTTPVERRLDVRMSPKDLINIGVFGALYLVIVFGINMLGFINPTVMLVAFVASIVAGGIPFMLFLTRVRHAGMVTIFAIVTAGLLVLTGHPLVSFVISIVCGLVAEVIIWAGRYGSRRLSVLAYAVYSVWFVGPVMPIFYDREGYYADPAMQMMGAEYISQMQALMSPAVLIAFDVSTILFGLLGGLLGLRLMRKHFEKAGLA